ncbi:hypothetical protein PIB30_083760 [Stylosanthes scabra]|uniref:Uncharacterized protein n=1 Tax=Stylosanthes scabra TaxID=79078 RepID=A0ABU6ZR27_9FABA|nr:hypothetical protein [Stylosanthes scabra]
MSLNDSASIGVHSSILDLIGHENMPRFKCGEAKFGAKVAGESKRNERIAKKPRRPKLEAYAYASRKPCVRIMALGGTPIWKNGHLCSCDSPNGSEGKERVKPVMLSADTPANIVAVPYSTRFTTVITCTSAVGPGDKRFDPVTAGTLQSSFNPGHRS